ncbi:hypothetical protein CSV80_06580 [Sporosarcina sp. P12(2017)]|uniref:immunoglobulin-like domain-containing protein n=1 Tax=unclassified Sporosarcina TaxID=2647733 RepID=UPI000C1657A2|nr:MULTISPECIES: immunoglobulin-like domain-containing protein [unclassified Sporosarcina]PIC57967.1 hypothetical protein CSV81_06725 [Sporosarcina sp. P10]PIC61350.1 hypothetical protein CSV80_06580 [Sporosarcina sp. P12(2017)]
MKNKNLIILIGIVMILAACSEEKIIKERENQREMNNIDSIYKDGDISISISVSQERYDRGATPVVIIRNDGETPVDYTGLGTSLEYLQDNVWVAADDVVTEDKLNVLEPGKKMEQKLPSSYTQRKGVYRVVFKFHANRNEGNKKIAFSFYVD